MQIINNLDKLIKQSKYRTKYIEEKLNINKNTLSSWRTGKTYPNVIQLLMLAELFNCSVEDIYKLKKENEE